MALNARATFLGFQFPSSLAFSFTPVSLPFTSSPDPFKSSRVPKHFLVCRSSQVQQQEQQIPFTESENSLIDALIGIQGRGRSASPQQLNVSYILHDLLLNQFFNFCFLLTSTCLAGR